MGWTKHPGVDNWDECWACYAPLEKGDTERHHYPLPRRLGGDYYVPLCGGCHTMIERTPLYKWPADWLIAAVGRLEHEPKLFVMKMLSKMTEREDFPEVIR